MRAALVAIAVALVLAAPADAGAAAQWRFEHPSLQPGVLTELGQPGDLQFRPGSDNRALLAIEGNATFPRMGLFTWDGRQWTPLAEVCGTSAEHARVAWAGPREFWTIAEPSPPRGAGGSVNREGLGLCHFKDGQVIGSFSRAVGDADPFFPLEAAACAGPDDCWFGSVGAQDPLGTRFGAFHLRWNGGSLSTVYAPQGRRVTDIADYGDGFLESVGVWKSAEDSTPPDLVEEEPAPVLLHMIAGQAFQNVDWFPNLDPDFDTVPEVPVSATELLALDVDGDEAWAVGGGRFGERGPVAVRNDGSGWTEVPLDPGEFGPEERFVDVAAIPGSEDAWVAVQPRAGTAPSALSTMRGTIARISPGGEIVERYSTQGPSGAPSFHGAVTKVDCASAAQCWLATYRGILYHYSDPALPLPAQDVDPAFSETIVDRPNEALEQVIPDLPPEDDSELFKPPPIELPQEQPLQRRPRRCKARPALIEVLDSSVLGRHRLSLEVEIRLRRRARVALVGYSDGRSVARTPMLKFGEGRHTLTMPVSRDRFPERLRFRTRELTRPTCGRSTR